MNCWVCGTRGNLSVPILPFHRPTYAIDLTQPHLVEHDFVVPIHEGVCHRLMYWVTKYQRW